MLSDNIKEIILINCIFLLLSLYSIFLSFNLIKKFKDNDYVKIYKCQPKITKYDIYQKLFTYIRNLIIIIILNTISLYYFRNLFLNESQNVSLFNTIKTIIFDVGLVLLIDDFFFYCFHRLMHQNKWLYINFHLKHHSAKAPLPIDILYVSIPELFTILFSSFLAISFRGGILLSSFIIFTIIKQLHEISIHSGIKSYKIINYVPFYGTNEHHDNHHRILKGNYASTFNIWDKIFNTEI